jgi:hypothetical protein
MRNAIPLSFAQFVSVHLLLLSALLGFFKGFQTGPRPRKQNVSRTTTFDSVVFHKSTLEEKGFGDSEFGRDEWLFSSQL